VRSISNTARPWGHQNTTYAGELSELDVVGKFTGDGDGRVVTLRPGDRVAVIQSGALFPDQQMLDGLGTRLKVGSMSGIPSPDRGAGEGMLGAARRGGFDKIVCYWGVLESRARATAGKAARWVPIAGLFVPDESQEMRIRLRMIIAEVQSGTWRSLEPEPIEDDRASSVATRYDADADQVEDLKEVAYRRAVELLLSELRS
jgi:hypothetical protein